MNEEDIDEVPVLILREYPTVKPSRRWLTLRQKVVCGLFCLAAATHTGNYSAVGIKTSGMRETGVPLWSTSCGRIFDQSFNRIGRTFGYNFFAGNFEMGISFEHWRKNQTHNFRVGLSTHRVDYFVPGKPNYSNGEYKDLALLKL